MRHRVQGLQVRLVEIGTLVDHPAVPDVPHYTHDGRPALSIRSSGWNVVEPESFSEWILSRPQHAREAFADDQRARRSFVVVLGEIPAPQ